MVRTNTMPATSSRLAAIAYSIVMIDHRTMASVAKTGFLSSLVTSTITTNDSNSRLVTGWPSDDSCQILRNIVVNGATL